MVEDSLTNVSHDTADTTVLLEDETVVPELPRHRYHVYMSVSQALHEQ
jgi:hypothetical protein